MYTVYKNYKTPFANLVTYIIYVANTKAHSIATVMFTKFFLR